MQFRDILRAVEKETRLSVSVEVCHPVFLHCKELKLAPDQYLHHSEFCRAAKQHDGNRICSRNKARSRQVAACGRGFGGSCPWGILEYAAPVWFEKQLVAIIYVGGMTKSDWRSPKFYSGAPPRVAAGNWRDQMRETAQFLRKVLELELREIALRGGMQKLQRRDEDFYIRNCLAFINDHYQRNIALADLAELLGVNPNYLGGLLRKQLKSTFREQLTRKRLAEAEILLRFHAELSIGEIAFNCGFSDSNYFSALFHRRCGMSPTAFRAQGRQDN